MRYDEFRDLLKNALREAGLFSAHAGFESETMELANANRHWESYVRHARLQETEPLHVSAKVAFQWSPVDAAEGILARRTSLPNCHENRPRHTETVFMLSSVVPHIPLSEVAVQDAARNGVSRIDRGSRYLDLCSQHSPSASDKPL
jgi:hypothetical protein